MPKKVKNPNCEFQFMTYGDKVISVHRRTSCWTEEMGAEGNVTITIDEKTGKKTATCQTCGNTFTWGGKE